VVVDVFAFLADFRCFMISYVPSSCCFSWVLLFYLLIVALSVFGVFCYFSRVFAVLLFCMYVCMYVVGCCFSLVVLFYLFIGGLSVFCAFFAIFLGFCCFLGTCDVKMTIDFVECFTSSFQRKTCCFDCCGF
jgi:hypothetical protein